MLYDQVTVKQVLSSFADDPLVFGMTLFDEGNYPVPYRGADNPFVHHPRVEMFHEKLVEIEEKWEGLAPDKVVAMFLGVFLPYVTEPNADYMLDEDTVYSMLALGAAAHIAINSNSETTIPIIAALEPMYSVAIAECVRVIGQEWQCPEAVDALQFTATLLIPSICGD